MHRLSCFIIDLISLLMFLVLSPCIIPVLQPHFTFYLPFWLFLLSPGPATLFNSFFFSSNTIWSSSFLFVNYFPFYTFSLALKKIKYFSFTSLSSLQNSCVFEHFQYKHFQTYHFDIFHFVPLPIISAFDMAFLPVINIFSDRYCISDYHGNSYN